MLPPSLFPNEPMDTMDRRYLNLSFTRIVSPLKHPLCIELYNDTYFPPDFKKINKPSLDTPSCQVDEALFTVHKRPLIVAKVDKLFDDSDNSLHRLEYSDIVDHDSLSVTVNLFNKLFFHPVHP